MKKTALVLLSIFFSFNILIAQARADELLNVQKNIDKNKADYSKTQSNLSQIKQDVSYLSNTLFGTEAQLATANEKVAKVRKDLRKVESDLAEKKETLNYLTQVRNGQIRSLYMQPEESAIELFLTSSDFSAFTANTTYQTKVIGESKVLIKLVNGEIQVVQKTKSEI